MEKLIDVHSLARMDYPTCHYWRFNDNFSDICQYSI